MPDGGPLIRITIRGGGLAVVDGLAYAAILPPPHPAVWIASSEGDGTIRFTEQSGGRVLGVPGTEPGTQACALEVGAGAGAGADAATGARPGGRHAVTGWRVSRCSDAGGRAPVAVKHPSELTSGYYVIEEPATGALLYRNRDEEPGLSPKPVALQPVGVNQGPLILQLIDED